MLWSRLAGKGEEVLDTFSCHAYVFSADRCETVVPSGAGRVLDKRIFFRER
jgi:hypothetical protein